MALRKSPEEKAAKQASKEREARNQAERKRLQAIEREKQAFYASPAGLARRAYREGDQVFQCEISVMQQAAIIVAMVGSKTKKATSNPVDILNSVCHEGWELVNGSFVFIEEGQQSRDKFMSSGQNVATKGSTVGYYLFKRCEANLRETGNPWEEEEIDGGSGAPAGWYPDPKDGSRQRYWDGTVWTEDRQPAAEPPTATVAGVSLPENPDA